MLVEDAPLHPYALDGLCLLEVLQVLKRYMLLIFPGTGTFALDVLMLVEDAPVSLCPYIFLGCIHDIFMGENISFL
jgi:hypothetical protein